MKKNRERIESRKQNWRNFRENSSDIRELEENAEIEVKEKSFA